MFSCVMPAKPAFLQARHDRVDALLGSGRQVRQFLTNAERCKLLIQGCFFVMPAKLAFLQALQERVDALLGNGRQVRQVLYTTHNAFLSFGLGLSCCCVVRAKLALLQATRTTINCEMSQTEFHMFPASICPL
jgi:hypothetical protein